MAEFASLDGMGGNIPTSGASADRLQLTTPNSMITGTSAGQQYLGGPNIFVDSVNSRIGVQQGSTPQVLMGKHPTLGEGFFVSKNGVNVVANTDPSQFIFNSSQNTFKIVKTGTAVIPAYSTVGIASQYVVNISNVVIQHGLSSIPAVIAYGFNPSTNQYFQVPFINMVGTGTVASWVTVTYTIDSTNLIFNSQDMTFGSGTDTQPAQNIKYYLLQETAN